MDVRRVGGVAGGWSGFVAGICSAINVHHEPWTCTIIRSSSCPHCTQHTTSLWRGNHYFLDVRSEWTTFLQRSLALTPFYRRSVQIAEHHNAKKLFFNSLPLRPASESQFEKLTHHSEPWFSLSFEALDGFRGGWKVETCRKYLSFDEISSEKLQAGFEKAELQGTREKALNGVWVLRGKRAAEKKFLNACWTDFDWIASTKRWKLR